MLVSAEQGEEGEESQSRGEKKDGALSDDYI